jgi:aminopeptidase N
LLAAFDRLPADDRLNLLGDTWALVLADRVEGGEYLRLLERINRADEVAVWEQVAATLRELDRLQLDQPGRKAFQDYARSILNPVYERLGWDARPGEPELDTLLRTSILSLLGRLGDESTLREARKRFAAFLAQEGSLTAGLRPAVFDIVGRYADQQTYDQLHELARKTESVEQKHLLYGAMGLAKDPRLADQTLALSLTDELEPSLAAGLVPKVAFEAEQARMAWTFLKDHYQPLLAKVSLFARFRYLSSIAHAFNETGQARDLMAFAKAHLPADTLPEIRKSVERIEFRDLLRRRELPKIDAWIGQHRPH